SSLDALVDQTVPTSIRMDRPLDLGQPRGEHELLSELRAMAGRNKVFRSCIGMGYHGTITPPVILRNVLENPGWYTQYTPYQAEISQGRLEALLNFQTMIADLTALPLAGASLLDEATAAAEAMAMCHAIAHRKKPTFLVAHDCHPQTIAVVQTRGRSLGVAIEVVATGDMPDVLESGACCGVLLQYPTTDGRIENYHALSTVAHAVGTLVVAAADLLALTLITPPGEFGADIAVGSAQRFGVPMGFGGPHAGYISTHEKYVRKLPGRIIGVSRDAHGKPALRMALQTREQHIKRERATSNICTAQALLAVIAGFYSVYHGPDGLKAIAQRVNTMTAALRSALADLGHDVGEGPVFDTLRVRPSGRDAAVVLEKATELRINLRSFADGTLGVTLDELVEAAGGYAGELKAFSPGGASSGFLPASMRDVPLAFKALGAVGSMLGSAGVVVLNAGADLRDAVMTQLRFFEAESCGQCAPCRIGTRYLATALSKNIEDSESAGTGTPGAALRHVADAAWQMNEGSICGLGQAAPLPLTLALQHFPEEFE
ncbi:MAG: hypothetical protein IID31_13775, partial [Planctomycetes bacterium]|nr:hypothetical protein [Planctomycetota bacterium]